MHNAWSFEIGADNFKVEILIDIKLEHDAF
jgi:hypothetical protein